MAVAVNYCKQLRGMWLVADRQVQLKQVYCNWQGFGVGATAVGVTLSVYAGARLIMNLPAGMLADWRGRKPLLVWGPAITALGETDTPCLLSRYQAEGACL